MLRNGHVPLRTKFVGQCVKALMRPRAHLLSLHLFERLRQRLLVGRREQRVGCRKEAMIFLTDMIGQKLHVLPRMLKEAGRGLTVSSPRCPQLLLHDSDVAAALFVFRTQAIEACRCAPHAPLTRHREEVSFFLAMMTTVSEPPEEFEHLRNGLHVESSLLLASIGGGGEALQHAQDHAMFFAAPQNLVQPKWESFGRLSHGGTHEQAKDRPGSRAYFA